MVLFPREGVAGSEEFAQISCLLHWQLLAYNKYGSISASNYVVAFAHLYH